MDRLSWPPGKLPSVYLLVFYKRRHPQVQYWESESQMRVLSSSGSEKSPGLLGTVVWNLSPFVLRAVLWNLRHLASGGSGSL